MDPKVLLDSLELGVIAIGADETIVDWNASAARLLGLGAEQVLGRAFWSAFPTARGTHLERALQETMLDGEPRVLLAPLGPDGAPDAIFELHLTRGPGGHLIIGLARPSAEGASLVAAFEAERALHSRLFQELPLPALVLSQDGLILDSNAAAVALLGASDAAAMHSRRLSDWSSAEPAPLRAALRDAATSPQRFRLAFGAGPATPREVEVMIQNVGGAETPRLLLVALDTSREVLLQRKLLQADRLALLGTLVSGVAHELNNPLAAVAAFAEVLKVEADDADLKASADVIHQEAMRAGRVVQTLLEFARQRPRAAQAVDLQEIADRVVELHRSALRKAGIHTAVAIGDDIPAVLGDPQELQHILLNVVMNAEQAIAATGRPGKIFITARHTDSRVGLVVEDTGPGIPPGILDRVFEPFFTTRSDQATGLGLAVSFALAKANGGRMNVENMASGGTRVAIELPVEEPRTRADSPHAPHPGARSLAVLIVDDEDSVRRGLKLMAECLGHHVTTASDYAEAGGQLARSDQDFDVILVDVHLDEANSGFDLYDRLREEARGRERRVIFTTGDSIALHTRERVRMSGRPVLSKPFSLEELRSALDAVLQHPRS